MANSPVDKNVQIMKNEHGTVALITDSSADRYLEQSRKMGTERYKRPCGGAGGWDDFCERMH